MVYSCSLIPKKVDVIAKPIERQIAQPILPRELQNIEFINIATRWFTGKLGILA